MKQQSSVSAVKLTYPEKGPDADVLHFIFETPEFLVWIDPDYDLDWFTSDEYDLKEPSDPEKHNCMLNRSVSLECIPNSHHGKTIRLRNRATQC